MGSGSAAHRESAALRPGHESSVWPDAHKSRTHLRILAAHCARALLQLARPLVKEGAGKAGRRPAPAVCCAKHTQQKPHSSIQVWPNARPSLRDGRTAYAVISREPNFPSGLPRPANCRCRPPGWARAHLRDRLDRGNDGQDHTVLPYATAPFVFTRPRTHRGYPPCPHLSCRRCCVHRNPARVSNDSRTAPLRRAGLRRCMPQFRISVKWNIFAGRG
jgi:hypothetical protein